jgi:hypothetical protein
VETGGQEIRQGLTCELTLRATSTALASRATAALPEATVLVWTAAGRVRVSAAPSLGAVAKAERSASTGRRRRAQPALASSSASSCQAKVNSRGAPKRTLSECRAEQWRAEQSRAVEMRWLWSRDEKKGATLEE